MGFCSRCEALRLRGLDAVPFQLKYGGLSYAMLASSAERGCELCELFRVTLLDWDAKESRCSVPEVIDRYLREDEDEDEDEEGRWTFVVMTVGFDPRERFFVHSAEKVAGFQFQRIKRGHDDPLSRSYLGPVPTVFACGVNERKGDDEFACRAFNLQVDLGIAVQWMDECLRTHSRCGNNEGEVEMPTRVIDVGPADGSAELRLVLSGSTFRARYLTLSHRWAGSNPLKLTQDGLSSFLVCIPFGSLPRTFQDAVLVTRSLGFRYLWIDSLCIIQDSGEDWRRECSRMANIYRHGALNIAASSATDCNSGFLSPRILKDYREIRVDWPVGQAKKPVVLTSEGGRYFDFEDEPFSTLTKRAWILQERLLSSRKLHFGPQKLFWECQHHLRHESLHIPIPNIKKQVGNLDFDATRPREEWLDSWYRIVEQYSLCDITALKDRLPALAGLASTMHDKLQDEYVAGLWRADYARGLGWRCENPESHKDATSNNKSNNNKKEFIAPSWSWASILAEVIFPYKGTAHVDLQIIDINVTPVSSTSPFADLISASLTIRGRTLRATVQCSSSRSGIVIIYNVQGGEGGGEEGGEKERAMKFWPDTSSEIHPPCEDDVLVLLLGRFSLFYHALVLQRVSTAVDQDVGSGSTSSSNWRRLGCIRSRMDLKDMFNDAPLDTIHCI